MPKNIRVSKEILEQEERRRKTVERAIALSEKIADLVASESVTVDEAERALRRAEAIVRTRTMVSLIHP